MAKYQSVELNVLDGHWTSESILQNFSSALSEALHAEPLSHKRGVLELCPSFFEGRRCVHWELFGDKLCIHEIWLDSDLKNSAVIIDLAAEFGNDGPVLDVSPDCEADMRDGRITLSFNILYKRGVVFIVRLTSDDRSSSMLEPLVALGWGCALGTRKILDEGFAVRVPIKALSGTSAPTITCSKWVPGYACIIGLSDGRILQVVVSSAGTIREAQFPDKSGFSRLISDFMGRDKHESTIIAVDAIFRPTSGPLLLGFDQMGALTVWDADASVCVGNYMLSDLLSEPVTSAHEVLTSSERGGTGLLALGCEVTTPLGRVWRLLVVTTGAAGSVFTPLCRVASPDPSVRSALTCVQMSSQLGCMLSSWAWEEFDAAHHTSVLASASVEDMQSAGLQGEELTPSIISSSYEASRPQWLFEDSQLTLKMLSGECTSLEDVKHNVERVMLRRIFMEGRFTDAAIATTLALEVPFSSSSDGVMPMADRRRAAFLVLRACREHASKLTTERDGDWDYLSHLVAVFHSFIEACEARTADLRRSQDGTIAVISGEDGLVRALIAGRGTLSVVLDACETDATSGLGVPSKRAASLMGHVSSVLDVAAPSLAAFEARYWLETGNYIDEKYMKDLPSKCKGLCEDAAALAAAAPKLVACLQGCGGTKSALSLLDELCEHYLWPYQATAGAATVAQSNVVVAGAHLTSRYGAALAGTLASSLVRQKLHQARCVYALFTFAASLRGSVNGDLLDLMVGRYRRRALAGVVYAVFLQWTSGVMVSSQNKLDTLINFNDMDSEAVFAQNCFNWRTGVADAYSYSLGVTKLLWRALWQNIATKVRFSSSGSDSVVTLPDVMRVAAHALRPSLFSDMYLYVKEAKELVVHRAAAAVIHALVSATHECDDNTIQRTLASTFTGVRAKTVNVEHLLLRVASSEVPPPVLYTHYTELLGHVALLDAAASQRSGQSLPAPATNPCSREVFAECVEAWVSTQACQDTAALVGGALLDMAIMEEFLLHIPTDGGAGAVDALLRPERHGFLVAFAILSQHLRALEVMSRSRALLPKDIGFDLALKVGHACLEVTRRVESVFAAEVPALDARMVKVHHAIFRFALSELALDEAFTSVIKMAEVSQSLSPDHTGERDGAVVACRDSLRALVVKCCSSQSLYWLCNLRNIQAGSIDFAKEVRMELKELARVGSVRALSTSAIGLLEDEVVDYAECYFAFLLSQDRCKDAAAAALQRLEIIRGVETREELLDVLDVQQRWVARVHHALSLLPEDEAFICGTDGIIRTCHDMTVEYATLKLWSLVLQEDTADDFCNIANATDFLNALVEKEGFADLLPQTPDIGHLLAQLANAISWDPAKNTRALRLRELAVCRLSRGSLQEATGASVHDVAATHETNAYFSAYGRVSRATTALSEAGWVGTYDTLTRLDAEDWQGHVAAVAELCTSTASSIRVPPGLVDSFFSSAGGGTRGNPVALLQTLFDHGRLVEACDIAARILGEAGQTPDASLVPYSLIDRIIIACELVAANSEIKTDVRDAHHDAKDALEGHIRDLYQTLEVQELQE